MRRYIPLSHHTCHVSLGFNLIPLAWAAPATTIGYTVSVEAQGYAFFSTPPDTAFVVIHLSYLVAL